MWDYIHYNDNYLIQIYHKIPLRFQSEDKSVINITLKIKKKKLFILRGKSYLLSFVQCLFITLISAEVQLKR